MSETKHAWTLGPWRTHLVDSTAVIDSAGREIASVAGCYDDHDAEEMEATAKLIAAAPALYGALEMARQYVVEFIDNNGGINGCEYQDRVSLELIDIALSAARGEEGQS